MGTRFSKSKDALFLCADSFPNQSHFLLISKEASGEDIIINLLLMHAEDQLMMTESIKILSSEIVEIYKRLKEVQ